MELVKQRSNVITQPFGPSHIDYSAWKLAGHAGLDWRAGLRDPVLAPIGGRVQRGEDPGGFGLYVYVSPGRVAVGLDRTGTIGYWVMPLDGGESQVLSEMPNHPSVSRIIIGTLLVFLAHLDAFQPLPNAVVRAGATIGLAGSTGNSNAVHVHEEWRLWRFIEIDGRPHPYKGAFNPLPLYQGLPGEPITFV